MWFIITHSVLQIHAEKQYDPSITIASLKDKLVPIVGTNPSYMKLELRDSKTGKVLAYLSDDNKTLQDYNVSDYMNIHVVDTDPNQFTKSFTDVSQVKKYVMSDEDYDKREDTFRKWKQKHIKQEKKPVKYEFVGELPKVGDRCELKKGVNPRGTIAYVGKTVLGPGYWVGIKLDEPYGDNNGT